jgi:hypothetical protein
LLLTDADYPVLEKLRDAYDAGGGEALLKAYKEFWEKADPLQQIRIFHAFWPNEAKRLIWNILAKFEDASEESIQRLAKGLSRRKR